MLISSSFACSAAREKIWQHKQLHISCPRPGKPSLERVFSSPCSHVDKEKDVCGDSLVLAIV